MNYPQKLPGPVVFLSGCQVTLKTWKMKSCKKSYFISTKSECTNLGSEILFQENFVRISNLEKMTKNMGCCWQKVEGSKAKC